MMFSCTARWESIGRAGSTRNEAGDGMVSYTLMGITAFSPGSAEAGGATVTATSRVSPDARLTAFGETDTDQPSGISPGKRVNELWPSQPGLALRIKCIVSGFPAPA